MPARQPGEDAFIESTPEPEVPEFRLRLSDLIGSEWKIGILWRDSTKVDVSWFRLKDEGVVEWGFTDTPGIWGLEQVKGSGVIGGAYIGCSASVRVFWRVLLTVAAVCACVQGQYITVSREFAPFSWAGKRLFCAGLESPAYIEVPSAIIRTCQSVQMAIC